MSVNTKKVAGRRTLRFTSLDDVLADLDNLEGKQLTTLGNWSVGQILVHLAIPMIGAIDGLKIQAPWYLKVVGRVFKRPMLKMKMPAGFKLPPAAAKALTPRPASDEQGFIELRSAIARFKNNMPCVPHPFLGILTRDEWNMIMCRHCELHLSFIQVA